MESITRNKLQISRLELGRLISVDFEAGTCTARSEMSESFSYILPIPCPYMNQTTGEGMKWMPRGGEVVILALLSDGSRRILAYTGVDEAGSYDFGFGKMNGGDLFIKGGNDSFIKLHSGGILELGSSPICTSIYIPTKNIMHHIAENWVLDTFAGSLEFRTDRAEDDDDGHTPTFMTLNLKEFSDDENELVRCKIGGGQDDLAFSLIIKDSGNGENTKASVSFSKSGDFNLSLEHNLDWNIKGQTKLTSTDSITLESKASFTQKAAQEMSLSGNTVKITSNTALELNAINTQIKSATVSLSNNAIFPVVRLSPDLVALLSAVSAVVNLPLSTNHFNPNVTT